MQYEVDQVDITLPLCIVVYNLYFVYYPISNFRSRNWLETGSHA